MYNFNILILEDETIISMHIAKTLKAIGCEHVYIAQTYDEALTLASMYTFHILFSDIRLEKSEYDGIETAKVLQKLQNPVVIFITAYNDQEILSRVTEVEFIGYLLKPYRVDELETLLALAVKKCDLPARCTDVRVSGVYSFDPQDQSMYRSGKKIDLSKKEQRFFSLLFNSKSVISYTDMERIVWYGESVSDNTRRTFIYRLKKRFPDLNLQVMRNDGVRLR
jgi:DNA-binding response OmpR family regulator